ncbi:hypothetical protein C8J56DRAFT_1062739 [Mycena floridula]|nr:hypothetical protein C8J56DRAFT_1062739 [Mycena floridula]
MAGQGGGKQSGGAGSSKAGQGKESPKVEEEKRLSVKGSDDGEPEILLDLWGDPVIRVDDLDNILDLTGPRELTPGEYARRLPAILPFSSLRTSADEIIEGRSRERREDALDRVGTHFREKAKIKKTKMGTPTRQLIKRHLKAEFQLLDRLLTEPYLVPVKIGTVEAAYYSPDRRRYQRMQVMLDRLDKKCRRAFQMSGYKLPPFPVWGAKGEGIEEEWWDLNDFEAIAILYRVEVENWVTALETVYDFNRDKPRLDQGADNELDNDYEEQYSSASRAAKSQARHKPERHVEYLDPVEEEDFEEGPRKVNPRSYGYRSRPAGFDDDDGPSARRSARSQAADTYNDGRGVYRQSNSTVLDLRKASKKMGEVLGDSDEKFRDERVRAPFIESSHLPDRQTQRWTNQGGVMVGPLEKNKRNRMMNENHDSLGDQRKSQDVSGLQEMMGLQIRMMMEAMTTGMGIGDHREIHHEEIQADGTLMIRFNDAQRMEYLDYFNLFNLNLYILIRN